MNKNRSCLMPQNVFEEKVRNKNPNIIILSEYKGQKEKVKIRCKKCGHEWEANGKSVLEGSVGCRVCAGSFSYSDEEFKKKLNEINPDIIPLEKYVKNNIKMQLQCKKCGYIWTTTPNKLLSSKTGCPKCNGGIKFTSEYNEQFREEMLKKRPDLEILETYKGADTKIKICCKKCGHIWKSTPSHIRAGNKCPVCSKKEQADSYRKNQETFVHQMKKINPTVNIKRKYINCKTKIKCECSICGMEWEATPSNLLKYRGCPSCKRSSTGEKNIAFYLEQMGLVFKREKTFDDCKDKNLLRFDFYIEKYNLCVEFDGEQHYRKVRFRGQSEEDAEKSFEGTKRRDKIKNEYCKKKNICLLRIPYTEIKNIEDILRKKLQELGRI